MPDESKTHSELHADERGDEVGWALDQISDGAAQAILAHHIHSLEEQYESLHDEHERLQKAIARAGVAKQVRQALRARYYQASSPATEPDVSERLVKDVRP